MVTYWHVQYEAVSNDFWREMKGNWISWSKVYGCSNVECHRHNSWELASLLLWKWGIFHFSFT